MSLSGKTALVTGGGSGIGEGIALALASAGCRVLISGRREEQLQEVKAKAKGPHPISICAADVADRASVTKLFACAAQELGHIDILVQSAGVNIKARAMDALSPEDWDLLMNVNATGAYNCMHAVLPQMRERKDGLIVNICSIAGLRAGLLGGVAYNASKFAMAALSTTVAQEEKDRGIRITNIYPGEVETPLLLRRPVAVPPEHLARILQPEDVAAAVLMICQLPPRAHVSDLVIKPTSQAFC